MTHRRCVLLTRITIIIIYSAESSVWCVGYHIAGVFADIYFREFREFLLVAKIYFAKFWVPRLIRVARPRVNFARAA